MKKLILSGMLLAVAGGQVQTVNAGCCGGCGWGWAVGAGILGGFAVGTAVGAASTRPVYYTAYPCYPYYPPPYAYSYPADPPAPQNRQPQTVPQKPTVNDNNLTAPSSPMSGANSLFGR